MPLEILEKIFFHALAQSDKIFPGHVCCTFQNTVAAIPRFNASREKAMGLLARLYVNDHSVFPKDKRVPGEIHMNVKRLSQFLGFIVVLSWMLDALSTISDGTAHGLFY